MSWIWILPAILLSSFAYVFYPLFNKNGGAALPAGLEGDPLLDLASERDMLLRQLKEMSLEGNDDQEQQASLESELAVLLKRFDELKKSAAGKRQKLQTTLNSSANGAWWVSVMLLVALLGAGLYFVMGTPKEVPPTKEQAIPSSIEINMMVQRLAERMQNEPQNRDGWARLARSYGALGKFDQAIAAYRHLLSLDPNDLQVASAMAEAQVRSGESEHIKEGVALFKDILTKEPDNQGALWFLGAVAFQIGERDLAKERWQRLLLQLQPGTEAYQNVQSALDRLKGE